MNRSVLFVLPFPVYGGAEEYVRILAEGALGSGWKATFLQPASLSAVAPAPPQGCAISQVQGSGMSRPFRLRSAIRRTDPGIVHVNHVALPAIAGALLARSAPVLVTSHTPALDVRMSRKARLLAALVEPRVDAWITLSERNAQIAAGSMKVDASRVHVVPLGLPPGRFENPLDRSEARRQLGVPKDAFVVGTVGRIAPQKRYDLLVRAAATAEVPNLHLVIIGDGDLRDDIQRLADREIPGRVSFPGHRSDACALLSALDVFCLSSDFEGLPAALLEAMAMGLPVVATDVQGMGEVVRDGVEGFLTPAGEAEPLTQAFRRLWEDADLARSMGTASRERFFDGFTSDMMVARTIELYESLLRDAGS